MRRRAGAATIVTALLLSGPGASLADGARETDDACPPGMPRVTLTDVPPDNVHEPAIRCLVARGIARGSSDGRYEPTRLVTRAQLASFIVRTRSQAHNPLEGTLRNHFIDDDGTEHEEAINRLAEAEIAFGDASGRFRPHAPVTRAQMASFLQRSHDQSAGFPLTSSRDHFVDDNGSPHEDAINRVAEAGIAAGDRNGRYRPDEFVRRDQMASFLVRFLDAMLDRHQAVPEGNGTVPPLAGTEATSYQVDPAHTGMAGTRQAPSHRPVQTWRADLGATVSYPLIVDDTVFAVASPEDAPNSGASLFALDAATGAVAWQVEVSDFSSWAAHTYSAGRVITIDHDGHIRAFAASTGALQWSRDLAEHTRVTAAPTAHGGSVFIEAFDAYMARHELLAVDVTTGEVNWRAELPSRSGAPAVTDHAVIVSSGCETFAFDPEGAGGTLLDPGRRAHVLWRHGEPCGSSHVYSASVHDGRVYARTHADPEVVLDAATGVERGTHPSHLAPAFLGDLAFAIDSRGAITGFDADSGDRVWRKTSTSRFVLGPIVVSGAVYAATVGGGVFAFDPSTGDAIWADAVGKVLVQSELDGARPPAGLGAGGGVLAIPTESGLVAYRSAPADG